MIYWCTFYIIDINRYIDYIQIDQVADLQIEYELNQVEYELNQVEYELNQVEDELNQV